MIIYKNIEEYFKTNTNNIKRIFIIDKNIFNKWNKRIRDILNNQHSITIDSSEKNKNIKIYNTIIEFLFEKKINREYTLYAIGGGIVGDISGFVASTFMRGIKLVHIPTTLLSMVDSSIGGKTGVNNIYGKNMIGTIYQAKDIVIDYTWLKTLPREHIVNGMAEVIKMALIKGGKLYDMVCNSSPDNFKNYQEMIQLSANYKLDIINNDFNDTTGQRELLNLGHTWGHALEFSNNLLHGYAVADGIIEEFKYTNYFYGYPALSTIKNILNLLKKWTLVPDNKSLQLSDSNSRYGLKMLYYYLSTDKKSNRIITLKDIGVTKIVTFDIEKWKFILADSFKVKNNIIRSKNINMKVPPSKSITNRAMICAVLKSIETKKEVELNDILISEDTELMIAALQQSGVKVLPKNKNVKIIADYFNPKGTYYLGNSGTSVRFLLPILAFGTNENIILDGSEEMRKRPIEPLVKSLNSIGCCIEYINNKGFLPLNIKKANFIDSNFISIDGTLSSQYISGMIFGIIFLSTKRQYKLKIIGEETSKGFINLTIKTLLDFGYILEHNDNIICLKETQKLSNIKYNIEGDATTASYLIAWAYLCKFEIILENLNYSSEQSDMKIIREMVKYFGTLEEINNKMLHFKPKKEIKDYENIIDLDSSDTFLTWACLFVIENKPFEFTNIINQNWKECARIDNFLLNLKKLGGDGYITETGFIITKGIESYGTISMPTYNDHRFAMSFSLISLIHDNVIIDNPHCVAKTYPKYWEDIKKLGVDVIPTKLKKKNIILIGMPGSGKTTLGKKLSDKLNLVHYDLDNIVINKYGSIDSIVNKDGWDKFRTFESIELKKVLEDDNFKIISTGGGTIINHSSRNLMESSIVILIKRNIINVSGRLLEDTYQNIMIERKNIYETMSDYIYNNDGTSDDFVKWLNIILNDNPIPNNSFFLCKNNSDYEPNISSLVELRGDMMENYGLDMIQNTMLNFNKQVIYTLRTKEEGGFFDVNNSKEYLKIIYKAIKHGCKYIDLEVYRNVENIPDNVFIIGSIHNNSYEYIDLNLDNFNYDILKIVTNIENCKKILSDEKIIEFKKKIIIDNSVGNYRLENRFMTPLCSDSNQFTAPNQLNSLDYMDKSYIYNNRKYIFLFGKSISESPSSYIHNYVFCKNEFCMISYLNYETSDINDLIKIVNKPYFVGASVTMPYKESIISNLKNSNLNVKDTEFTAANTVISKNNIITFDNTDIRAIIYHIKNLDTVILGTGGSAIGAIEASIEKKINNIIVVGRNVDKLKELSKKFNIKTLTFDTYNKLEIEHNLINCLPPNVNIDCYINKSSFLIDMTYGIHNYNSNVINGYDILYVQAAYQFMCWFDGYQLENIISDYKEGIDSFLSQKYK